VNSEESSTIGAEDCAPCADSNLTLKEKIQKLDDMELVYGNEGESD
jgi:hypothetical protein